MTQDVGPVCANRISMVMLIEISDRPLWIKRVQKAISEIEGKRKRDDAAYEKAWANKYDSRSPVLRFFIGPRKRKPTKGPETIGGIYPSIYAWGDYYDLKRILRALQSDGTGVIKINGDELRMIAG